jgi:AcrR family transcriptional regulator
VTLRVDNSGMSDAAGKTPPHYARYAWKSGRKHEAEPNPKLNTRKVIQGAIELVSREGLDRLTIRRLAGQLGFTTMAVYRHIASFNELLILMVDASLGEPPASIGEAVTWQEALQDWGNGLFARYQEHPWVLDLGAPGLPTTPNHVAWVEAFLKAMEDCRLTLQQKMDAALLIDGHVRNIAKLTRRDKAGKIEAGIAAASNWLPRLLEPEKYPNFLKVLQEGVLEDATGPELSFGLNSIIAGLEAQL